jgi:hypothetical protein
MSRGLTRFIWLRIRTVGGWGGVNWIHLTQDGDQWRILVNTVMNLQDP